MMPMPLKKITPPPISFPLMPLLLWLFLLHGCIPGKSSNIVTVGPDSYRLAKEGADSLDTRQSVWREADTFCRGKKQYFMAIAKNYDQNLYEMEFHCLNAGDPELSEGESPFQKLRYNKKLGGYGEVKY